jgi:hypothetical protein
MLEKSTSAVKGGEMGQENLIGIRIIGRIYRIFSLFSAFGLLFFIFFISRAAIARGQMTVLQAIVNAIFIGATPVLQYLIGTGLLGLKRWALNFAILTSLLGIILHGNNIIRIYSARMDWKLFIRPGLFIIFFGITVFYLTRSKVREQFRK